MIEIIDRIKQKLDNYRYRFEKEVMMKIDKDIEQDDIVYDYTFDDIKIYFHMKDADVIDIYVTDETHICIEYIYNTKKCSIDLEINRDNVRDLYMKYLANKVSCCY